MLWPVGHQSGLGSPYQDTRQWWAPESRCYSPGTKREDRLRPLSLDGWRIQDSCISAYQRVLPDSVARISWILIREHQPVRVIAVSAHLNKCHVARPWNTKREIPAHPPIIQCCKEGFYARRKQAVREQPIISNDKKSGGMAIEVRR